MLILLATGVMYTIFWQVRDREEPFGPGSSRWIHWSKSKKDRIVATTFLAVVFVLIGIWITLLGIVDLI